MTSVMPRKAPPPPPTEQEIAAARGTAKRIIEKARSTIVLDHPFFSGVMMKKPLTERLDIPTMAVSPHGHMSYNPTFIAKLTNGNMVFVIAHEVMHYLSGHHRRYLAFIKAHGLPDNAQMRKISNMAGDYWINDTLVRSKVGDLVTGCLMRPGSADRTYEEIFKELLDQQDDGGDGPRGNGPSGGGDDSGDPIGEDLDDLDQPMSEAEASEAEAQRKLDVAQAEQAAKSRGKLPGVLAKFASDTIEVKTPWYSILERYMAGMAKYEVSWAKPNRRYAPSLYMPSTARAPSMGEIVLQIDVSGSVSAEEIKYYNGHIKRIVEMCNPETVHVMYVDTAVCKHETFDNPEDVKIEFYSGGGTDMEEGFRYISSKGIDPDIVVVLTDGYTGFTKAPDFPVVWCCSTKQDIPYGDVVRFDIV